MAPSWFSHTFLSLAIISRRCYWWLLAAVHVFQITLCTSSLVSDTARPTDTKAGYSNPTVLR